MNAPRERSATVVVIGGGQSGLSAAYHLRRRGFASALTGEGERTFVVLDADPAPGGAWQHRWDSLRMATVNGIFDLPGFPKPPIDPDEPSRTAVPRYFAAFERRRSCRSSARCASPPSARRRRRRRSARRFDAGRWRTRAVINATGTWTNPVLPHYPGRRRSRAASSTPATTSAAELAGLRVAVVGGGISAVQQLEEISRTATVWYTRREPVFLDGTSGPRSRGAGRSPKVAADVEAGRPTGSVVSYTGLIWTPYARAAGSAARSSAARCSPRSSPTACGRPTAPSPPSTSSSGPPASGPRSRTSTRCSLRNDLGGIRMAGTQVAADPRVHLIGFGPSQSTVGANRAGRDAVAALSRHLRPRPTSRTVGARPDRPEPPGPAGRQASEYRSTRRRRAGSRPGSPEQQPPGRRAADRDRLRDRARVLSGVWTITSSWRK